MPICSSFDSFLPCRKRKPRKNTTKGWVPKDIAADMQDTYSSAQATKSLATAPKKITPRRAKFDLFISDV